MPAALVPVFTAAGLTGGLSIAGLTVSFASIAAYGVSLGATVGASMLVNSIEKRTPQNNQITIRQSIPARVRGYGKVKIGGAMFYMGANRTLLQGIVFCEGPIEGYDEVWLNDYQTPFNHGVNPYYTQGGWSWGYNVAVTLNLGGAPQSVNSAFAAAGHYWIDGSWQLNGLAYCVLSCSLPDNAEKNFSKTYPTGVPVVRVVARLSNTILDPRTNTTGWTQNSALIVMDYLTNSRGFNIPLSRINIASFIAMANLCDEQVPLAAGGSEPRYQFNGTYTLDTEPRDVLKRLLASCDGEIVQLADGTIGIRGGQWTAPTVTLSDAVILSYEAQQGFDKLTAFNQLIVRWRDMSYWGGYQVIEGWPWNDTAAQARDGEVLSRDFDGTDCNSATQAGRLAKIAMFKGNPAWVLTLKTNLAGLNALGERIVNVVLNDLGINGTFFVNKFEIDGNLQGCTLTLGSLTSDAYEWSTAEEGTSYGPGSLPAFGYTFPTITGFNIELVQTITSGAITAVQAIALITPPADLSYSLSAQISSDGGATFVDMTPAGAWSAISGPLAQSLTYEIQVALRSSPSQIGPYSVQSVTIAPQSLDALTAALSSGTNEDYGLTSDPVTIVSDWGLTSDVSVAAIDLGAA